MTGLSPATSRDTGVGDPPAPAAQPAARAEFQPPGRFGRLIFWGLLATVLLSPLPFGSIQPWSFTLMSLIVGGLVLLWSADLLISGRPVAVPAGRIAVPALLFLAVLAWAAFQAVPWSPAAWHNPDWAETARVLERPVPGFISVDPDATRTGIMRLLSYAGIFWLALQFGRSAARARQVFRAVAVAGLAYAAYGLAVEITDSATILWFDKERYRDSLTATFRYKNAYAAYAGLGLLCTLALLIAAIGREDYDVMGRRERTRVILSVLFERAWYLVLGVVVLLSALALAHSRGGVIATVLAVGCLLLCLQRAKAFRIPYGRPFFAAFAAVSLLYLSLSGGTVLDRLSATSGDDIRSPIYRDTATAIAERPLLGWGLGSFEGVFAKYQGPEFRTRTFRAHNEYLDNALGLGVPATAALVIAVAWLGGQCVRGTLRRRRDQIFPAAGAAAVVLAAAQSAVDFTMQEPAVVATFALILGTACAQSRSRRG